MMSKQLTKKPNESDDDSKKRVDVWNGGEAKWEEGVRSWTKEDAKAIEALGKIAQNSRRMGSRRDPVTLHSNLRGRLNQICRDETDDVITPDDSEDYANAIIHSSPPSTKIRLQNVFYAPTTNYTPISISQTLDGADYSAVFRDGKCIVHPRGSQ